MSDLEHVDAELDALGAVPDSLSALLEHYGESDRSADNIDGVLEFLAEGVAPAQAAGLGVSVQPPGASDMPTGAPQAPSESAPDEDHSWSSYSEKPGSMEDTRSSHPAAANEDDGDDVPREAQPSGRPSSVKDLLNQSLDPDEFPQTPSERPAPVAAADSAEAEGDSMEMLVDDDDILEIDDDELEMLPEE